VSPSLGISTGGSGLALYAGGNFTVQANDPSQVLINAPGAVVQIIPGFATASTVVFNAEVIAQSVTIGSDSGLIENGQPDKFRIRPSEHTPINVVGFNPVNVLPGDSIFPLLNDPNIVNATITKTQQADGFSGVYTIMYANNTTTTISFRQIESFEGISFQGLVVQTGVNQYSIRLQASQGRSLGGFLSGTALQTSPFVVAPNFIDPLSSFTAPSIAFGDVNGDGTPDLIIANGANDTPVVTVINGNFLFGGFFAYDPIFRGGVNVAVGDYNGDGTPDIIAGAGPGGGPHVEVFENGDPALPIASFFAYDPIFRGGVLVGSGVFDGAVSPSGHVYDDIVTAPGFGGGPQIEVFGFNSPLPLANFYAWNPNLGNGLQLLGGTGNNGVGSVAFGSTEEVFNTATGKFETGILDPKGRQEILVS